MEASAASNIIALLALLISGYVAYDTNRRARLEQSEREKRERRERSEREEQLVKRLLRFLEFRRVVTIPREEFYHLDDQSQKLADAADLRACVHSVGVIRERLQVDIEELVALNGESPAEPRLQHMQEACLTFLQEVRTDQSLAPGNDEVGDWHYHLRQFQIAIEEGMGPLYNDYKVSRSETNKHWSHWDGVPPSEPANL
jgi:hypothetical protein